LWLSNVNLWHFLLNPKKTMVGGALIAERINMMAERVKLWYDG
jgi:hypothetical protein